MVSLLSISVLHSKGYSTGAVRGCKLNDEAESEMISN